MQEMNQGMMSQSEIDRLLSEALAPTKGDNTPPPADAGDAKRFRIVRPYDFKHPNMLSKDQLRTMQMVFETCARLAGAGFARELRTQVTISLTSVEQSTFQEYMHVLNEKKTPVLNTVSAEPLPGSFVFEYSLEMGFIMIDHLLGGGGQGLRAERQVTEIEGLLLQSMGEIFTDAFGHAWADLLPLTPALQKVEFSPRFLQVTTLAAPVLVVIFDVRMGDRSHELSICLPFSMIEGEVTKLNMQTLFLSAPGQTARALPEENLSLVRIPITVELGRADVPFETLISLAVGDLIRLDGCTTDPVLVRVNGQPSFLGRPGLVPGGRMGVQVLTTISTEEEIR